jgi:tetratricopeptide (TPR) repeat protein
MQPDCWQAHYNEALLSFSEGDRATAIVFLRDACALAPAEPEPMFRLALALDETDRPREALVWYRRAVEVREKFTAARLRAALILMKFGSWVEAAEEIEHCLDSEEDGASMWYHYAICQLELGDADRARTAFEESHKRRQDSAPVLQGLALLAILDGSLELAAKFEQAAEECGEESAAILYRLALAFQERGNQDQARYYYRRSLQVDPSLARNYFN